MALIRGLTVTGLILALAGAGAAVSTDAQARGLFDFLFGGGQPQPVAPAPSQPAAPRPVRPAGPPPIAQQRTYCVRTCDGYYFAIGFVRNKSDLANHESMCASSCGTEPMVLYTVPVQSGGPAPTGPAIERATNASGALYTALPTAFGFRDSPNPACGCKSTANGLPQIPISIDPTLRNGDIIVMQDGLKVYRGNGGAPHSDGDFVSAASAKSLSSVVRQQMMSLQNRISQ